MEIFPTYSFLPHPNLHFYLGESYCKRDRPLIRRTNKIERFTLVPGVAQYIRIFGSSENPTAVTVICASLRPGPRPLKSRRFDGFGRCETAGPIIGRGLNRRLTAIAPVAFDELKIADWKLLFRK